MQYPIEESAPGVLLETPFRPRKGFGAFTRLRLRADAVEVVRAGFVSRRVPLGAITSVAVTAPEDAVNLVLRVTGEGALSGRVDSPALWRLRLGELLGLGREAALPPSQSAPVTPAA